MTAAARRSLALRSNREQPTPRVARRTITCDPPEPGPSSGWGWKCDCGSHDTGYAASWLASEAAEYHRGSP